MRKFASIILLLSFHVFINDGFTLAPFHDNDHVEELAEPASDDPRIEMVREDLNTPQNLENPSLFERLPDLVTAHGMVPVYRHQKTGLQFIKKKLSKEGDRKALEQLLRNPINNCVQILGIEDTDHFYELDLRPYGYVPVQKVLENMRAVYDPNARILLQIIAAHFFFLSESNLMHGHPHMMNILINPQTGRLKIIDFKEVVSGHSSEQSLIHNLMDFYLFLLYEEKITGSAFYSDEFLEESFRLCSDKKPFMLKEIFYNIFSFSDRYTAFEAALLPEHQLYKFLRFSKDIRKNTSLSSEQKDKLFAEALEQAKSYKSEGEKIDFSFPVEESFAAIINDPRTPLEFLTDLKNQMDFSPQEEKKLHEFMDKAHANREKAYQIVEQCLEKLDKDFGKNNYSLVSMERGMRDYRFIVQKLLLQHGRTITILPVLLGTKLLQMTSFIFADIDPKDIALEYLAQSGISAQRILEEQKTFVLLDTAFYGRIIRPLQELLVQSLEGSETDDELIERIQESAPGRNVIYLYGDGLYWLEQKLRAADLSYKVIWLDMNARHHWFNMQKKDLEKKLFSDAKDENVVLVYGGTDPDHDSYNTESARFLRQLGEKTLHIKRLVTPEQKMLRNLLPLRMFLSKTKAISGIISDDDVNTSLVYLLDESPKPHESLSRLELIDNKITPIISHNTTFDQALSLVWLYTLLHSEVPLSRNYSLFSHSRKKVRETAIEIGELLSAKEKTDHINPFSLKLLEVFKHQLDRSRHIAVDTAA